MAGRPKGYPKTGGRKPGVRNKLSLEKLEAIADARAAIGLFVDGNAHRLQGWLDAIADGKKDDEDKFVVLPNPVKAFELFQSVIEYHVPKLARTELTGKDGGPVIIQSTPTDDQL